MARRYCPIVLQLLIAFIGGVVTLVPILLISPRRRQLHLLRDEALVLKEIPSGAARRHMERAHIETAAKYERRIKGLDRVEVLRRQTFALFPFWWVSFMVSVYLDTRRRAAADLFGVKEQSIERATSVAFLVTMVLAAVMFVSIARTVKARLDRHRAVAAEIAKVEERDARREANRAQRKTLADAGFGDAVREVKLRGDAMKGLESWLRRADGTHITYRTDSVERRPDGSTRIRMTPRVSEATSTEQNTDGDASSS